VRAAVAFVWLTLLLSGSGCAHWKEHAKEALDDIGGLDPEEQRELAAATKQVMLAPQRHGGIGLYAAGGADPEFRSGGGELGMAVNSYWWDCRAGLAFYGSGAADDWFLGPTAAVHLQLPTRLAPFVGVGVFGGYSRTEGVGPNNGFDDNGNDIIDEYGELTEHSYNEFLSIFPEVGLHFWLTDYIRLTASASYHITTEGRDHDFWMVGGGVALISR
jgi:hypothetical protein